jgi:hypothetical protein
MGATKHPATWSARECNIRPHRKLLRKRVPKMLCISIRSFLITYFAAWFIGIIARSRTIVKRHFEIFLIYFPQIAPLK